MYSTAADDFNKSLEDLRPFPKASPRKPGRRGRPQRKLAVLTSPVVSQELRTESEKRTVAKEKKEQAAIRKILKNKPKLSTPVTTTAKAVGKRAAVSTKTKSPPKRVRKQESSSSDDDDDFCIICFGTMPRVLTPKNSTKCNECKREVHLHCVKDPDTVFYCQNCYSP